MSETPNLSDHIGLLRRRIWIVLQAVILVPAAAVVFALQQEPVYSSSAEVLLSRQNLAAALAGFQDSLAFQDPERLGQTQADVARAPALAEQTVESVDSPRTAGELLANSEVTPKVNADLLVFTVEDRDPKVAVQLANAYALEYTRYRRDLDTQTLRNARAQLTARIRELEADGVGRDSELYSNLVDKEQELRTLEALQTSNTTVSRPASGAIQIEPRVERTGFVGVLLGLVLGIGLAYLWNALDRRVRSEREIQEILDMPLLARLPAPPRRLRKENELAMLTEPSGLSAEAFRMLRTSLEFASLESQTKMIMITSARPGEGKSTTIANLGVAFALSNRRTVLVDLDLRRPILHTLFGVGARPGITDVVLGSASLDSALQPVPLPATYAGHPVGGNGSRSTAGLLNVLSGGTIPPNPGDLVRSAALENVLKQLRKQADVVLIDAPPMLAVGDALALSAQVDGVLTVIDVSNAHRRMLSELARLLHTTATRRLGFVVTGARKGQIYGYGYGGYDSYPADAESPAAARR